MSVTPMLIGGRWRAAASGRTEEITSPYSGSVVGVVPRAGLEDVPEAVAGAERGAAIWRRTPAHERMRVMLRAAEVVEQRVGELAATITAENGKTITEATTEASRCADTIRVSAFEGAHLYGDSLPLDANPGTGLDKDRKSTRLNSSHNR
jgi:acyl-CoA reductase-like NAD-dependent aldehyde dehydrogenase